MPKSVITHCEDTAGLETAIKQSAVDTGMRADNKEKIER